MKNLEIGKKYKLRADILGVRTDIDLYYWGMVGRKYNFGYSSEIGVGFNHIFSKSNIIIKSEVLA